MRCKSDLEATHFFFLAGACAVKHFRSREVRQALVGKGNLHTLLSDQISSWDPYQPGIRAQLKSAYETAASNAWHNAKSLFSTLNAIEALENTWASVAHIDYLRKFLEMGVILENELPTIKRLLEIKKSVKNNNEEDINLYDLLFKSAEHTTPDLLTLGGFSDEIRVRWSLASKVQAEKSYLELLKSASFIETYESQKAHGLLIEAIKAARGKSKKKLSWEQTVLLSDKEFELLTIDSGTAKKLNTDFNSDYLNSVKNITDLRRKYKKDRELIKVSMAHLVARDWKSAGKKASSISVDQVSRLAAKSILSDNEPLQKAIDLETKNSWSPMDKNGYENLAEIFGIKVIPHILSFTSDEIAELLIEGKISQHSLKIDDVTQLNLTWNAHTKNRLITAGQYKAVDNEDKIWSSFSLKILAYAALEKGIEGERLLKIHLKEYNNAKEILETIFDIGSKKLSQLLKDVIEEKILFNNYRGTKQQTSWMSILCSQVGTDLWINLVKKGLIKKATFEEFSLAITQNSDNTKLKSFEDEAINALKAVKNPSYENAVGIMDWICKSPESIGLISKILNDRHLNSILNLKIGDCSVIAIKQLYWHLPENYKFDFWKMLMNHVTDADDLITFGIDAAEKGFETELNHRWNQISGGDVKRARALCLMSRRDGSRLRQIATKTTAQLMAESLFWVANNTPKISLYDRISLELSATLGLRHWSTIRWLISQRDPRKFPGTKFDHLYTIFEIPKKSGKPRLISAPSGGLKRVQKSILVNLLNPIGAHESAFGFLQNKSITDNAAPHVGKRIVVNVDIQNCFPSVAWQLVLSALKRDLSTQLSDKSISFLVDICTSNGSLPIGSPASPALLNRVLLNTDNILSKQADLRSCTYTRYADDLTFSGDEKAIKLIGVAKSVLSRIGLFLDPAKTNIFRRGRRQVCTGLVVNDKVNVPRNIRRRIRAAIHSLENEKPLHWNGNKMSTSSLRGRIEFVKMVSPEAGDYLAKRYKQASSGPVSEKHSSQQTLRSANSSGDDRD
jgi:hypothetical protein